MQQSGTDHHDHDEFEPQTKKQKVNPSSSEHDIIMTNELASSQGNVRLIMLDPLEKHSNSSMLRNKLSSKTTQFVHKVNFEKKMKTLQWKDGISAVVDFGLYRRKNWYLVGNMKGIHMFDAETGDIIEDMGAEGLIILKMYLVENDDEEDFLFFIGKEANTDNRIISKMSLNGKTEYCFSANTENFKSHNLCDLSYNKESNELFVLDETAGQVLVMDGSTLEFKKIITNKFTRTATSLFYNELTRELFLLTGVYSQHFEGVYTDNPILSKCYGSDYNNCDQSIIFNLGDQAHGMVYNDFPHFNIFFNDAVFFLVNKETHRTFKELETSVEINACYYDSLSNTLLAMDNTAVYQLFFKFEIERVEVPITSYCCKLVEDLGGVLPKYYQNNPEIQLSNSINYFSSITWEEHAWFEFEDLSGDVEKFYFFFENPQDNINDDPITIASCLNSCYTISISTTLETGEDLMIHLVHNNSRNVVKYPLSVFLSKLKPLIGVWDEEENILMDIGKSFERLLSHSIIDPQTLEINKDSLVESYRYFMNLEEGNSLMLRAQSLEYRTSIIHKKTFKMMDLFVLASFHKMLVKIQV